MLSKAYADRIPSSKGRKAKKERLVSWELMRG